MSEEEEEKDYCEECGKLVPIDQLIDDVCDDCYAKKNEV